jgi:hypothetical protein
MRLRLSTLLNLGDVLDKEISSALRGEFISI